MECEWILTFSIPRQAEFRVMNIPGGRGIFVTTHARTPFWKLFLRRTQAGMVFRNVFFLALVELTHSLSD
jgi:hypothetical protein